MQDEFERLFPWIFPVLFVGVWVIATFVLGAVSGWYALASRYPDRDEAALLKIGAQSGYMGEGLPVSMNGILVLSACPSGLRVAIWRLFGPFCRPFLVPWTEISSARGSVLMWPMVKLTLGSPGVGRLAIKASTWTRLLAAAPQDKAALSRLSIPPQSDRRLLWAALVQWAGITAFAATFFYLIGRTDGANGAPLAVCIGFPAVVVGIVQIIRYAGERQWR